MWSSTKIILLIQILLAVSGILTKRVAVVTGANRGIGYAIVSGLLEAFDGDVYLTARDEERGKAAVKKLTAQNEERGMVVMKKMENRLKFHLLDITVPESVEKLRDHMSEQYGGIDVLVNNAGIAFKLEPRGPIETPEQARETLRVNYFGLRDTCNILFPILKPHARVVHLSGSIGHLGRINNDTLRATLAAPDITEEKLSQLMNSFLDGIDGNRTYAKAGWPNWAYAVSKTGVFVLTRIQQRELSKDESRPDIVVNHVHPGYVRTNMTNNKGRIPPEEGAEAPIYLATLPENCTSPKGHFVWNTKQIVDFNTDV